MSVLSEIDGPVIQNACKAEIVSFEESGFCLFVYLLYPVVRFLRDYHMAWYDYGNRVQSYCMGDGTDTGAVMTEFCEVTVADQRKLLSAGNVFLFFSDQFP